jgi:hypothetical protein
LVLKKWKYDPIGIFSAKLAYIVELASRVDVVPPEVSGHFLG